VRGDAKRVRRGEPATNVTKIRLAPVGTPHVVSVVHHRLIVIASPRSGRGNSTMAANNTRHCEERSDEAISSVRVGNAGRFPHASSILGPPELAVHGEEEESYFVNDIFRKEAVMVTDILSK